MVYAEIWCDDRGGLLGIDVNKARLNVALGGAGELLGADNDTHGIAEVVTRPREVAPGLIVLGASGGLETWLVGELAAAQLPVAVVNPRQVRDFAHSIGQLAKTDALYARVLALFAERMQPPLRTLPDEQTRHLPALITRRRAYPLALSAP